MANKVYGARETPIVFAASGGTAVFTPTSLANGAGRISAQVDRGASSHAMQYLWRARMRAASSPTVGNALTIFLVTADDATYRDGDFGTSDAAISTFDLLRNVQPIGTVVIDEASTTKDFVRSGTIWCPARYLQVAWWNAFGVALSSTAGDMSFSLTPVADEVQ